MFVKFKHYHQRCFSLSIREETRFWVLQHLQRTRPRRGRTHRPKTNAEDGHRIPQKRNKSNNKEPGHQTKPNRLGRRRKLVCRLGKWARVLYGRFQSPTVVLYTSVPSCCHSSPSIAKIKILLYPDMPTW